MKNTNASKRSSKNNNRSFLSVFSTPDEEMIPLTEEEFDREWSKLSGIPYEELRSKRNAPDNKSSDKDA